MPRPPPTPIRRQSRGASLAEVKVRLRPDLLERVKARAARERRSVSAVIAEAVEAAFLGRE